MRFTLFVFLSVLLLACSESFEQKDPSQLNKYLAERTDLETPEQVIKFYYAYPMDEWTGKETIDAVDLGDGVYEVTLIHQGLGDDALAAEKIVMKVKREGKHWRALEIKKNWRCYDGYGHTDWGTGPC